MNNQFSLHIAAITHRGKVREHNEDCIAFGSLIQTDTIPTAIEVCIPLDSPIYCLVADGIGGNTAGEIASRFVAERLLEKCVDLTLSEQSLSSGLRGVNRELYSKMAESNEWLGMGTTVAGMLFGSEMALAFNVGDSRVYRRQGGFLAQISTDDVPGAQRYSDAAHRKTTSTITQSLGGATSFMDIVPHIVPQRFTEGSLFLICSDGLTDMVNIDDLEEVVSGDNIISMANFLLEKALNAGGDDNISIILIRVEALECSAI